jgi:hypothetical protein
VAIIYITQCAEDIIIHNIIQICTLFDLYIITVQKNLQTCPQLCHKRPNHSVSVGAAVKAWCPLSLRTYCAVAPPRVHLTWTY